MKGMSCEKGRVLEGRACSCWSGCVPVGEDVSFESRHILVRECVSFWMGCVSVGAGVSVWELAPP